MKTDIKHEYHEFLVISLKHVSTLTFVINHHRTPKLWAIAHENGHKREYDEFLVISLKLASGLTVVVNRPITPTVGNSS